MLQLAVLFLLSSPQTESTPSIGEAKANIETAAPKKQHFDMEDEIVIGEDARPLHDLIVKRPTGKFGSLIPIRYDFNDVIALSALDL